MLKRIITIRKEAVFLDPETRRVYRRVAGGLGWPWEPRPGYLVVMGELYAYDAGLKGRPLEILAEREAADVGELYRGCLELRRLLACDNWQADLEQGEAVRLFRKLNRQAQERGPEGPGPGPVHLRRAPYSQENYRLQTLFQVLGTVQSPERKLLTYGPESRLPGLVMGLDAKDMNQPPGRHPALAALGYAVAEMIFREPWERGREPQVISSWDIYQAR